MKLLIGALACTFCVTVQAQVLTTGETGGQGKSAVFTSVNRLYTSGLTLTNGYAVLWYGFNNSLDGAIGIGAIEAEGESQVYAVVATNLNLLRRSLIGVDVAPFQATSIPLTRRDQSAGLLSNIAVVASRPVGPIVPYTGGNILVPIGNHPKQDKLFTPPTPTWMLQLGVNVPVTTKLSLYGEVDWGPNLKAVGVGALLLM